MKMVVFLDDSVKDLREIKMDCIKSINRTLNSLASHFSSNGRISYSKCERVLVRIQQESSDVLCVTVVLALIKLRINIKLYTTYA